MEASTANRNRHSNESSSRVSYLGFAYKAVAIAIWVGTIAMSAIVGKQLVAAETKAKRLDTQVIAQENDLHNLRNDRCRDGLVAEVESRNDHTLLGRQWIVHATAIDTKLPRYGMAHIKCTASSLDKDANRIYYSVPTRDEIVNGPR